MAGIRTVLIIDSNKKDRAKVAVFLEEYYMSGHNIDLPGVI